ncbi:MAG: hypothetical protein WB789_06415 [Thermoplasmata archaeon]
MEAGAARAHGRAIVRALRRLGDETGSPVLMETKEGRIRLQKLVYLLKVGRYGPAQKFEFNIYQNGPYSPDLTKVYYQYGNRGIAEVPPATDIPPILVETIRGADSKGVIFLEALTTALDTTASLRKQAKVGGGLDFGLEWARSIKPHIGGPTWREVREFLAAHPDLAAAT